MEKCDVYAWGLRDRLPTVHIPLKAPDEDVAIDLAAVFDTTYDRGRYARAIDYKKSRPVELTEEHQTWASGLLQSR